MTMKELFSIVTKNGHYVISYIRDGWLREESFEAGTPTQLAYLWDEFAEAMRIGVDAITQIERLVM